MTGKEEVSVGSEGEPEPFRPIKNVIDRFKIVKDSWTVERLITYMVPFSEGVCISNLAIYCMFREDYDLSEKMVSLVYAVPVLPCFFRPFMAYLLDKVPLFGTQRKYYLVINSFLQCVWFFILGAFKTRFIVSYLLYFLIALNHTFCGMVAEFTIAIKFGADEDAFEDYFTAKAVSSLLVSFVSDLLLERHSTRFLFFISGLYPLLVCCFASLINEETEDEVVKHQYNPLLQVEFLLDKPISFYAYPILHIFLHLSFYDYYY